MATLKATYNFLRLIPKLGTIEVIEPEGSICSLLIDEIDHTSIKRPDSNHSSSSDSGIREEPPVLPPKSSSTRNSSATPTSNTTTPPVLQTPSQSG